MGITAWAWCIDLRTRWHRRVLCCDGLIQDESSSKDITSGYAPLQTGYFNHHNKLNIRMQICNTERPYSITDVSSRFDCRVGP